MEQNLKKKIEDAQRFHQKGQLDLARKAYKKILEKYLTNSSTLRFQKQQMVLKN